MKTLTPCEKCSSEIRFRQASFRISELYSVYLLILYKYLIYFFQNIQWIIGNRERTQSASVSTESYEKKLFEILQSQKCENEGIFDKIEVS